MSKLLTNYSTLHWWNFGQRTLDFEGELRDLLKEKSISFRKRKVKETGLYQFYFKNDYGISFKARGILEDYSFYAKQFLQMELVRMGDKSTLYVSGVWRPTVTINH